MPTTTNIYNQAKQALMAASLNVQTDTLRLILVKSSYVFSAVHSFLQIRSHEVSGVGYERKVLTGKTVQRDDVANRIVLRANDLAWNNANFGAYDAAVIYKQMTNDSTHVPIAHLVLQPNIPVQGGLFRIQFDEAGILVLM